jgi:hypothetical protein
MLSLGQVLDSLTVLAGLAQHGNMKIIRGALYQVAGPDLLLAVLIVGLLAGTAEEIFFRGYVQTRLVQRLPRGAAVIVTSICFGAFHLDWLHSLLALVLGLYLGWITELTGSALPAVVCHVVNNALFTLVTSRWGGIDGVQINVALAAAGALVFVGVVAGSRHAPSAPVEGAWFTSIALRSGASAPVSAPSISWPSCSSARAGPSPSRAQGQHRVRIPDFGRRPLGRFDPTSYVRNFIGSAGGRRKYELAA